MKAERMFEMSQGEFEELQDDSIGLCVACGARCDCCEPDACAYTCEECGARKVYGAEELLTMGLVSLSEEEA